MTRMLSRNGRRARGSVTLVLGGLVAVIVIFLAACGGSIGSQTPPSSNPAQSSGNASSPAASTPAAPSEMPSTQPTQSSGGGTGWG